MFQADRSPGNPCCSSSSCHSFSLFSWRLPPSLRPSPSTREDKFALSPGRRRVVSTTAGRRLLARAMPKYIPGQPDMIVQNMPGAGSLVALNYVYGVVKPDGLTAVMPNSNVYLEQLSGHKEVRFDLRKFPIIGSQEKNFMLLYMRADAPYKTIGEIIKAQGAAQVRQHGHRQRRIHSRPRVGARFGREDQYGHGLSRR